VDWSADLPPKNSTAGFNHWVDQRGRLLYAHYGKGIYIYCAYALYRQFPAAVPGAYRILANLVSAGAPHASN
jgi:hypothetical protein